MNSQPKISVIVPVYKVENFLDRCVEMRLYLRFWKDVGVIRT